MLPLAQLEDGCTLRLLRRRARAMQRTMSHCSLSQPSSGGEEERDMVRLLIHRAGAKALRLEGGHKGAVPILGLVAAFQGTPTVVAWR